MNFKEEDLSLLLKAVKFSADKHKTQRRKGAEGSPYINHPIDVAETLWNLGGGARYIRDRRCDSSRYGGRHRDDSFGD